MTDIKANSIEILDISKCVPNKKNRNKHSDEQITRLADIIKYQGFRSPLIISNRSGLVVAGHGRLLAAKFLGLKEVPVIYQDFDSEEQEYAAQVSDNAIASWAELDLSGINADIGELGPDFDLEMLGIKDFELEPADKYGGQDGAEGNPSLSDRFLIVPFSVLDARQGAWQNRKREWLALGIKSEIGRGGATEAHQSQDKLRAPQRSERSPQTKSKS
jgi:hypothetical protein